MEAMMYARSPYDSNDSDELERLQVDLQEEIGLLEQKLAAAQARQIDMREGKTLPRKQSRRLGKAVNLRAEALQELDSYIFTITYKLKQAQDRFQIVMRKLHYLNRE